MSWSVIQGGPFIPPPNSKGSSQSQIVKDPLVLTHGVDWVDLEVCTEPQWALTHKSTWVGPMDPFSSKWFSTRSSLDVYDIFHIS